MKFLTGKPFPTFDLWFAHRMSRYTESIIKQEDGSFKVNFNGDVRIFQNPDVAFDHLRECLRLNDPVFYEEIYRDAKLEFREGCIQEALEIRKKARGLKEPEFPDEFMRTIEAPCGSWVLENCLDQWLFGLLEASLGEKQ